MYPFDYTQAMFIQLYFYNSITLSVKNSARFDWVAKLIRESIFCRLFDRISDVCNQAEHSRISARIVLLFVFGLFDDNFRGCWTCSNRRIDGQMLIRMCKNVALLFAIRRIAERFLLACWRHGARCTCSRMLMRRLRATATSAGRMLPGAAAGSGRRRRRTSDRAARRRLARARRRRRDWRRQLLARRGRCLDALHWNCHLLQRLALALFHASN